MTTYRRYLWYGLYPGWHIDAAKKKSNLTPEGGTPSMIQVQSTLHVTDNSGARQARCLRILNKSRSKTASVGDLITVSLRQVRPNKRVKRKAIHIALVVRTKQPLLRPNGFKISLGDNSCILVGSRKDKNPLGTRLTGPVGIHELRKSKSLKCILLSKHDI